MTAVVKVRRKDTGEAFQVTQERVDGGDWPDWFQEFEPVVSRYKDGDMVEICGGDWDLAAQVGDWVVRSDDGYIKRLDRGSARAEDSSG